MFTQSATGEISRMIVFGSFFVAMIVSYFVTPLAIRLAPKIGAMDIPKDERRMHSKPMPRFGGMAVFCGCAVAILVFMHSNQKMMAALLGGTLIYLLGVWDDLRDLRPRVKFIGQLLVATLMYVMGLRIEFISNYAAGEGHWQLGSVLCFVVTILWIVGITNTINLVDGLDGLATGIAAVASLSIAYVAYIHGGQYGFLVVCAGMMAVAGSAIGFLPHNFYPAKTFLGDSGSLFLGFMIAVLSVVGPLKRSTMIAVVVPVIVLGIPIFDTFFAIVRRLVNKRPIMQADKGHLHHKLMASGYGQRRAVIMLYGISAIMGMAAVLMSRELYKDSFILMVIAGVYLYVFLTDLNHKMPHIRAVNVEKDEKKAKKSGEMR